MSRLTATETLSLSAKLKRAAHDAAEWAKEARAKDQEVKELRDVVKALRRRIDQLERARATEDAAG